MCKCTKLSFSSKHNSLISCYRCGCCGRLRCGMCWYKQPYTDLCTSTSILCLYTAYCFAFVQQQARLMGGCTMFSICLSVRPSVRSFVWKQINRFLYRLAQEVRGATAWNRQFWRSGSQRSKFSVTRGWREIWIMPGISLRNFRSSSFSSFIEGTYRNQHTGLCHWYR